MSENISKALVREILENPYDHKWTLQGFGMLRLYISDTKRLHIWDASYAFKDVSLIHDHPWDFNSYIVAGVVRQHRFDVTPRNRLNQNGLDNYEAQTIVCGEGGCSTGNIYQTGLKRSLIEIYREGDEYSQKAEEIHLSIPESGTVTIINRVFKEDTEHANVFWPIGEKWVSAEPRKADEEEIYNFTQLALSKWFNKKEVSKLGVQIK